jgi:hypothetical protein
MATKMEVVKTEIGIEKFEAAVTDNPTVMVKALATSEDKYRRTAVYTRAAHTLYVITGEITTLKSDEDTLATCKNIVK